MLVEKMREQIKQFIDEIPDELLEKAYVLDVIQKSLQLSFNRKVYEMFFFRDVRDNFLEARLSNGLEVAMGKAPFISAPESKDEDES